MVSLRPSLAISMAFVACQGGREASHSPAASDATASDAMEALIDFDAGEADADGPMDDVGEGSEGTHLQMFPHDFTDAALAALTLPDATCSAPTASGIGLGCTRYGRQCPPSLLCTADFQGDSGICTILGCGGGSADCGDGASCCTLLAAGGASLCIPNPCLPDSCLEGY